MSPLYHGEDETFSGIFCRVNSVQKLRLEVLVSGICFEEDQNFAEFVNSISHDFLVLERQVFPHQAVFVISLIRLRRANLLPWFLSFFSPLSQNHNWKIEEGKMATWINGLLDGIGFFVVCKYSLLFFIFYFCPFCWHVKAHAFTILLLLVVNSCNARKSS